MNNLFSLNSLEMTIAIASLLVIIFLPPIGVLISFAMIAIYLVVGKERKEKLKSIGFKSPSNWGKIILITLLLGIAIEVSFQIFFNPIIEKITQSKIDLSGYENIRGNFPNYLIMLLVGWIVGGFIEEIVFRGFLITRLAKIVKIDWIGNLLAVVVTSAVFGFSHMYQDWSGVISTGIIAILFGVLFLRYNKVLWYTILTHGFVNLTGLTLIYLNLDKELCTLIFK